MRLLPGLLSLPISSRVSLFQGGCHIRLRILGTAAGGGFPQWNCRCRYCEASRRGLLPPRLQASAAFSPDGEDWYIINATPDITTQLRNHVELHPSIGQRHTPIKGVILTDAELDHTLGLLHLREGAGWTIHATQPVLDMLDSDLRVAPALAQYGNPALAPVDTSKPLVLGSGERQAAVHWLETGQDPPRYAEQRGVTPWSVSALIFEDLQTGRKIAYAPGVAQLDGPLLERLAEVDALLIDGTFWSDDEFPRVGGVPRTAADMGHAPIGGPGGTAELLSALPASRKLYVHINNTNPVLEPRSEARQFIRNHGLELAEDGEEVTV